MKYTIISFMFFASTFIINPLAGQGFTELENGVDMEVDGMIVSYSVVKKQTKKGNDLYRLTATITSHTHTEIDIFNNAEDFLIEDPKGAIAYFQFTNATGKAFSETKAYFYPTPIYVNVDYTCDKCPPLKKDEDPKKHKSKSVIIGTEFPPGSTSSNVYNIRVPEGEEPTVRVMIY
ncbi:MAG: hypothetical protein QM503_14555 [Bacteroidota bacterium]